MASDRWSEIERIFHAALAHPPEARSDFVRESCKDDDALRREVQTLLDEASQSGFLEQPAMEVAAGLAVEMNASTLIGRRLGVYEIHGLLGRGGMGEVYRARDTRLARDVAIKVLPPGVTGDPDRLARFEREARVLASLNHPHIGMIHGLEETGGTRALILELVEGDTLAGRIARGPVPVKQALTWARQIADALDTAHEKGIVHRDLKPANIKITPDGVVKVLDFGLARTYSDDGAAGDETQSSTITSDGGRIVGTAAYMSPEQARGQPVSKRADIWAFGCVLYELLTGRMAFKAPTVPDTLVAVLNRDPDWTALPPALPSGTLALIQRCLEKDLKQRRRDIGDVRAELDDAIARPTSDVIRAGVTAMPPHRTSRPWLWLAAAAGIVAMAAVVVAWSGAFTQVSPSEVSFQRITDTVDIEDSPAVSPDGKEIAFVRPVNGRRQIWVHRDGGGQALQITSDDADHDFPRWLPKSTGLVYFTSAATDREPGELNMIPVLGGTQPRFVAASITGGDVSHDGRIAAFQKTGDRVVLTILDVNWRSIATIEVPAAIEHLTPRWSPDASAIAFVINGGRGVEYRIHVVDVATGELKQIRQALRIRGVCWLPDGSGLIYASAAGSTLLYPPVFQLRVVSRDGDVERQLISGEDSYVHPDMVQSGKVLSSRIRMKSNLWRYPVAGSPAENVANARQITDQASQVQTPTVSPDETEIAYLSDSGGHANVWVIKTDGSDRRRQLTFERDPGISVGLPLWAPKGHAIVYVTLGGSSSSEWIVDSRGRESPRVLAEGATAAAWTGDAKWIYYQRHSSGTSDIFKMAADRSSGEIPVRRNASIPAISPDGATLYYSPSHPGNAHEIYRANPPDTGAGEFLTRYSPSRVPYWPTGVAISPDGRWLAVPLKDGGTTNIWTISTVDGTYRQITSFGHRAILIARQVSWSPKSDFIYAAIQEDNADVVLLDGIETSVRRAR